MTVLRNLGAIYMLLLAIAVAANFLVSQFYDPALEGAAVDAWRILDPLMVLGLAAVLINSFARKRRQESDAEQSVTREYLESNFVFYYSAALMLALLWNWFGFQWVEPSNDVGLIWTLIDVTLPLLLASTGIRILRGC